MQKLIASISAFALLFISFTPLPADAYNAYRGSRSYFQNLPTAQERTPTTKTRYYYRRSLGRRTVGNAEKNKRTSPTLRDLSRRISRRFRPSTSSTAYRATPRGQKSTSILAERMDPFITHKASKVNVALELPEGFAQVSDSLQSNSGKWVFRRADSKVTLHATSKRCDGSVLQKRRCLQTEAEILAENQREDNKSLELVENEAMTRSKLFGVSLIVDGHKTMVQDWDRQYAFITFRDPNYNFMWYITVETPHNSASILGSNYQLSRIFSSIKKPSDKAIESSPTGRSIYSRTNDTYFRGTTGRSRNIVRFGQEDTHVVEAENLDFSLNVPMHYSLQSDDLTIDGGQMTFASETGNMTITATKDICLHQNQLVVQRCLQTHSRTKMSEVQSENPGLRVLQDGTQLLSLQKSIGASSHVRKSYGKFVILRDSAQRTGILAFPEPHEGHVWIIHLANTEQSYQLLNDTRQLNQFFSSLMFGDNFMKMADMEVEEEEDSGDEGGEE